MKFQLFALLSVVIAGVCAIPSANDAAVVDSSNEPGPTVIVDDIIRRLIEHISKGIKKAGLDPLEIKKKEIIFPRKPSVINVKAFIENLKYVGASNIQINSLDYSILLNKLVFDISLPQLNLAVGDSGFEVTVFKKKVDGQLNGSLITESIRLAGEISVNIKPFDLRNVSMNFSLGDIKSDLRVSFLGANYSDFVNNFFNKVIPNAVKKYGIVINKALEDIVKAVFYLIHLIVGNSY